VPTTGASTYRRLVRDQCPELARGCRSDRRGVDDERARPSGAGDLDEDLAVGVGAEHHDHDGIRVVHRISHRHGRASAAGHQLVGFAGAAVPDGQLVSALEHVAGHRPAHPTQPQESDAHTAALPACGRLATHPGSSASRS